MSYCFSCVLNVNFNQAIEQVTAQLKEEGFGVLTSTDITATFKSKLDVDFRNYVILGACHPQSAYRALQSEPRIGVFLPCNVIVQELDNGTVEVSAVDPVASMGAVENDDLGHVAIEIREKLQNVINHLV